ncbi:MAG: TetR/AcrR family transcriptional regulator [Chthoniobacter sp.]|nr:TetR/AcrR family transcriptional regulator [Chthoniobacter sp.]
MISDVKKHQILQGAARIFFESGFSTGMDRVISDCGVAKMTVYMHFKTKNGLICAILDEIQAFLENHIRVEIALNAKPPRAQLEAASLILCNGMSDQEMRAGLAVRALISFPNPRNAVHERARQLDLTILRWFEQLCAEALLPDAERVARTILHIAKGCFLMAPTIGVEASQATALSLLSSVLAPAEIAPPRRLGIRRSNGHSPSLPGSRL